MCSRESSRVKSSYVTWAWSRAIFTYSSEGDSRHGTLTPVTVNIDRAGKLVWSCEMRSYPRA